ncbi:MAG: cytochrome bd-I oxidase subunit CydX [Alcaligenaceae bacterium]|jgi:cyd operon protein YbgT|nr:cytochrome bd-I oxidase subunit CydX [Alcaligenaceae bacterium]
MWYLTWMLGTAFACGVAVAIGLWYELHQERLDAAGELPQEDSKA